MTALPSTGSEDLIFYDGNCGLCHGFVKFVLRIDPNGVFHFAPLKSDAFFSHVPEPMRAQLPDSVVVKTAEGQVLIRSAGVRYVLSRLGGGWRFLARVAGLLPTPLLDFGYDFVARIRHRLFKPPPEACPLMPKELRTRFLY